MVEHGVAKFNQKDFFTDLMRPLNSVKEIPQELQLIKIDEFEVHDINAVDSIFKKYSRLFRCYFLDYKSDLLKTRE